MSTVYELSPLEIERRLIEGLKQQLNDEKSCFNLYTFSKGDTLSKDEILYSLRTFYISLKVEDSKMEKHCHLGNVDGATLGEGSISFAIDYDKFIDTIIEHYEINVIESCSANEYSGLICKDFLMSHFEDKKSVNLMIEVQRAKNAKDFKKRILDIMQNNITHWKKEANGGCTGMNLDGYHSFYTGSLFVNDFKIDAELGDAVCDYRGVKKERLIFAKANFWETLYEYLLKESGATLF